MKKIKSITLALFIILLIPTSAFASTDGPKLANGWQTLYNNDLYLTTSSYEVIRVDSGGGNLEVCAFNMSTSNNGSFEIYEEDPSKRNWISSGFFYPNKSDGNCRVVYVDPYVDGSNDEAELAIELKTNGFNETVTVRVRD